MIEKESGDFLSLLPNMSFTLEHKYNSFMIVNQITISSRLNQVNGTYPIGRGLIFSSNSTSLLDIIKNKYADWDRQIYENW